MRPSRLEYDLWRQGYHRVAGVDEAGRGPLAGPVVAAAVVLPVRPSWKVWGGVEDSKVLTPGRREILFDLVRREALAWSAAVLSHQEIDRVNILQATLLAMRKAVIRRGVGADYVLVDGNKLFPCPVPAVCVVGGDRKILAVAAASVVAKVVRDRIMGVYGRRIPGYGFERHFGYATAWHRDAVRRLGPCRIHRKSFRLLREGDEQPWLFPE